MAHEMAVRNWFYQCLCLYQHSHYQAAIRDQQRKKIILLAALGTRHRRYRVRPLLRKRMELGFQNNLIEEMRLGDHESFFNFHRMTPRKFEELLEIVGPHLLKTPKYRTDVISVSERLAITLRYLASGDSMASLQYSFRVSVSTISNIVNETCAILWGELKTTMFPEPTEELWLSISEKYFKRWNFPNCIGAIDGKHVVIQKPNKKGSQFINYKGTHSLVLMAICDAEYCLTLVDIGAAGRQSDGGVFKNSLFGQALNQNLLNVPAPKQIPGSRRVTPHLIVADAAFPMTQYMMRPYPQRGLSEEKRIFNYRLSRARRVIENVFGIMAARWRILRRPIIGKLENIEVIIQATCILHNFLQRESMGRQENDRRYCPPGFVDREAADGTVIEGDWRAMMEGTGALEPAQNIGPNAYRREVGVLRQELTNYFMEEGQVAWQRHQAGLE